MIIIKPLYSIIHRIMPLSLLAHIALEHACSTECERAFWVDGLGGVLSPSASEELRINVGASQIRLRQGAAHVWAGHLELWTCEALQLLYDRLLKQCETVIAPMLQHEEQTSLEMPELLDDRNGLRLLCYCPSGNMLLIRAAPPTYHTYTHGSHPGGIGGLVAITRAVHHVALGAASPLRTCWTQLLGCSRAELVERPGGVGSNGECIQASAHVVISFASGQQIIFDERPDAETLDKHASAARGYHLAVYVDTLSAYQATFEAVEEAGLLHANPQYTDAAPDEGNALSWEAAQRGQYRMKHSMAPLPMEDGRSRPTAGSPNLGLPLELEVAVRSVAHAACPLPRADIVAGGATVDVPEPFRACSTLKPPPHAKPGVIRIPHGQGGFGEAAKALARKGRSGERAQKSVLRAKPLMVAKRKG